MGRYDFLVLFVPDDAGHLRSGVDGIETVAGGRVPELDVPAVGASARGQSFRLRIKNKSRS